MGWHVKFTKVSWPFEGEIDPESIVLRAIDTESIQCDQIFFLQLLIFNGQN